MRKKVLILGAGGQLGQALGQEFRSTHESLEAVHHSPQPGQLTVELADPRGTTELLDRTRPDWILIPAAFCNVDLCETERERCRQVNALGPRTVAEWARANGARVVYYSTDHVFDGAAPAYSEEDPVSPLSVYARAKVEGEQAVRELLPEGHLILRTSGLYGPEAARKNFVVRLVDQLRAGETVRVPSDQWGSPTYNQDLAGITRFLLEKGAHGTYHAVGPDFLPRIELARKVCSAFRLDERLLEPVETSQLRQPARRPLRVRLNTRRLESSGAPPPRPLAAGLETLKKFLSKPAGA